MITVLRNRVLFVRTAIIITIFYISIVHIFKATIAGHLLLSPLKSASVLNKWTLIIGLKK